MCHETQHVDQLQLVGTRNAVLLVMSCCWPDVSFVVPSLVVAWSVPQQPAVGATANIYVLGLWSSSPKCAQFIDYTAKPIMDMDVDVLA